MVRLRETPDPWFPWRRWTFFVGRWGPFHARTREQAIERAKLIAAERERRLDWERVEL